MEKEINHTYPEGPFFSIITVTYNAGKVLERTLQSVLRQSYPNIEYLIIDGGSKDNTLDLVRNYHSGISYWISERDKGLYDAMNKGLQKATGDYVLFLNAGDTFRHPDTLAEVARITLEQQWPDILYGETDLVDDKGRFIAARRLKTPEHLSWKSFKMGMLVCHQAFIPKRSIAPLYDLEYRFSADFDWCIRCMKAAGRIQNTHLRLIHYLSEGMTTANRKASLKERYRIMVKYYGNMTVWGVHLWFAVRFYWAKLTRQVV